MQNFNKTLDLQTTEADSAGNAMVRYGTYATSTQARIDDFKNSVQKMWMAALSSDTINGIIKFGTNIVNLVDKIGLLNIAIPPLAGLLSGVLVFAITSVTKAITAMFATGASLNAILGGIPVLIGLAATAIAGVVTPIITASNATKELNNQFNQINNTYQQSIKSANEAKNTTLGQAEEARSLAQIIEDLNKKESLNLQEKQEMKYAVSQLNDVLPNLNATIDSQTGKLVTNTQAIEDNITALKNQAIAQAYQSKVKAAATAYASEQDLIGQTKTKIDQIDQQLNSFDEAYRKYWQVLQSFKGGEISTSEELQQIKDLSKEYNVDLSAKNATLAKYLDLQDASKAYQKTLDDENSKLKEYDSQLNSNQQKAIDYSKEEASTNQKALESFTDAESQKQLASNSFLQTLYTNNQSMYNGLKSVYGVDANNFQSFNDVKAKANALLIETLGAQWQQYYSTQESALQSIVNMGSSTYNAGQESAIVQAYHQGDIDEGTEKKLLSQARITTGINTNAANAAQALLNAYSAASNTLSGLSSGSNSGSASGNYMSSSSDTTADKKAQTAAEHEQQAIIDNINNQEKQLESTEKARTAELDKQKSALQDQLDLVKKQHEEQQNAETRAEDAQKVADAQKALSDAQNNKNVMLLQGGRWIAIADPQKVADAQKALQEAQTTLKKFDEEQQYNSQVSAIQSKIDSIDKQKSDLENNYNAQKQALDSQKDAATEAKQSIRGYASGTLNAAPGLHTVGEGGEPEIVTVTKPTLMNFRGGETVTPLSKISGLLSNITPNYSRFSSNNVLSNLIPNNTTNNNGQVFDIQQLIIKTDNAEGVKNGLIDFAKSYRQLGSVTN